MRTNIPASDRRVDLHEVRCKDGELKLRQQINANKARKAKVLVDLKPSDVVWVRESTKNKGRLGYVEKRRGTSDSYEVRIGRKVFRRNRIHLRKLNLYNLAENKGSDLESENKNIETDLEQVKSSSSDEEDKPENFSQDENETLPNEGNGQAMRRE